MRAVFRSAPNTVAVPSWWRAHVSSIMTVMAATTSFCPAAFAGSSLYRNTGSGNFSDVTQGSGLEVSGEALGCAAGDYDNDGRDGSCRGISGSE